MRISRLLGSSVRSTCTYSFILHSCLGLSKKCSRADPSSVHVAHTLRTVLCSRSEPLGSCLQKSQPQQNLQPVICCCTLMVFTDPSNLAIIYNHICFGEWGGRGESNSTAATRSKQCPTSFKAGGDLKTTTWTCHFCTISCSCQTLL